MKAMRPTPEQLAAFARAVAETADHELDCDEALDCLAAYLEQVHDREIETLPPPLQAVAQHLRICPECSEELRGLRKATEGEAGGHA